MHLKIPGKRLYAFGKWLQVQKEGKRRRRIITFKDHASRRRLGMMPILTQPLEIFFPVEPFGSLVFPVELASNSVSTQVLQLLESLSIKQSFLNHSAAARHSHIVSRWFCVVHSMQALFVRRRGLYTFFFTLYWV
jgi:hypothetical protein